MKSQFNTAINVEIDWVIISQTSEYDPWHLELFDFMFTNKAVFHTFCLLSFLSEDYLKRQEIEKIEEY